MKTIIKIGEFYISKELATQIDSEGKEEIILLESLEEWDKRENLPKIQTALAKLTDEEKELLGLLGSTDTIHPYLLKTIADVDLSVRAYSALKSANIKNLHQLITQFPTQYAAKKIRGWGNKSNKEVEQLLLKEASYVWPPL